VVDWKNQRGGLEEVVERAADEAAGDRRRRDLWVNGDGNGSTRPVDHGRHRVRDQPCLGGGRRSKTGRGAAIGSAVGIHILGQARPGEGGGIGRAHARRQDKGTGVAIQGNAVSGFILAIDIGRAQTLAHVARVADLVDLDDAGLGDRGASGQDDGDIGGGGIVGRRDIAVAIDARGQDRGGGAGNRNAPGIDAIAMEEHHQLAVGIGGILQSGYGHRRGGGGAVGEGGGKLADIARQGRIDGLPACRKPAKLCDHQHDQASMAALVV